MLRSFSFVTEIGSADKTRDIVFLSGLFFAILICGKYGTLTSSVFLIAMRYGTAFWVFFSTLCWYGDFVM